MATIRRSGEKYQVRVHRIGQAYASKTFHELRDARAWARLMEVKADKGDLLADPKIGVSFPGPNSLSENHLEGELAGLFVCSQMD